METVEFQERRAVLVNVATRVLSALRVLLEHLVDLAPLAIAVHLVLVVFRDCKVLRV